MRQALAGVLVALVWSSDAFAAGGGVRAVERFTAVQRAWNAATASGSRRSPAPH